MNKVGSNRHKLQEEAVERNGRLPAPLVYEIVRRDGVAELRRPSLSLISSGVAAGIVISFSVVGEALLRAHVPDVPWRPLIENLGYTFGFLIVILGRMQLFTENTITTVIPLWSQPSWKNFLTTARLWSVVFAANLVGAMIAAVFIAYAPTLDPKVVAGVVDISRKMMSHGSLEMFIRGIPAGIIIAAIVWMLPSSQGASFWIVLFFTYLIALGEFTHVIAGSVEASVLLFRGDVTLSDALLVFLLPAFFGNVVGGTAVFTLLAYGQVREELRGAHDHEPEWESQL